MKCSCGGSWGATGSIIWSAGNVTPPAGLLEVRFLVIGLLLVGCASDHAYTDCISYAQYDGLIVYPDGQMGPYRHRSCVLRGYYDENGNIIRYRRIPVIPPPGL